MSVQTRKGGLRGFRASVATVRGSAELRGGAGDGAGLRHGACAALAGAYTSAQRVQATCAPL